jgi:nicotinamide riboside transporter PnuC
MGELTDLVFTVLGKMGRWFNVKGQRVCFILWAFCLVYWIIRNFSMDLYVQTAGCFISFAFHIYGWWNWKNKGIGK